MIQRLCDGKPSMSLGKQIPKYVTITKKRLYFISAFSKIQYDAWFSPPVAVLWHLLMWLGKYQNFLPIQELNRFDVAVKKLVLLFFCFILVFFLFFPPWPELKQHKFGLYVLLWYVLAVQKHCWSWFYKLIYLTWTFLKMIRPLRSTEIISTEKGVFMNASGTDEPRPRSWLIVLE